MLPKVHEMKTEVKRVLRTKIYFHLPIVTGVPPIITQEPFNKAKVQYVKNCKTLVIGSVVIFHGYRFETS